MYVFTYTRQDLCQSCTKNLQVRFFFSVYIYMLKNQFFPGCIFLFSTPRLSFCHLFSSHQYKQVLFFPPSRLSKLLPLLLGKHTFFKNLQSLFILLMYKHLDIKYYQDICLHKANFNAGPQHMSKQLLQTIDWKIIYIQMYNKPLQACVTSIHKCSRSINK